MDNERIANIVAIVKSKKASNKKSNENTVDTNKERVAKIAIAMLEIEKCITKLED